MKEEFNQIRHNNEGGALPPIMTMNGVSRIKRKKRS